MRDALNRSLETLIWIATAFFIFSSCWTGAMIIRYSSQTGNDFMVILGGFLMIIFGVTMSFVFAGISFQVMDIRRFTKHVALGLQQR